MQYIINRTFFLAKQWEQRELQVLVLKFFCKTQNSLYLKLFLQQRLKQHCSDPLPILQCLISTRSKFVLSRFNLARLSLKAQIAETYVLGTRKASW